MVESSKEVDDKPSSNVESSPQYYQNKAIDINDISKPWKSNENYRNVICKTTKWTNMIEMEVMS